MLMEEVKEGGRKEVFDFFYENTSYIQSPCLCKYNRTGIWYRHRRDIDRGDTTPGWVGGWLGIFHKTATTARGSPDNPHLVEDPATFAGIDSAPNAVVLASLGTANPANVA
jgi:hypothetical protein